jgi:uncharacterized lipoprotein YajG
MEILKLLVRVMIFLLSIIIIQSCSGKGWIIASVPVTPQDTVQNTVFIEILDADSTMHWYHGKVNNHANYCYKHNQWEEVEVK